MIEPTVIVPELHKDERLGALCPDLHWLCPLHQAAGDLAVPWPLSTAEAVACLREAELWVESGLTETEARSRHNLACAEDRVHREYRAAREVRPEPASTRHAATVSQDRESLREAQRFLLFAWAQEERLLEIRRLAMRYAHEVQRLHDTLHDDAAEGSAAYAAWPEAFTALSDKDEARLVPFWRPVLERLALFLPAAAALCTQDKRLIESLHDAGLCRTSPEDTGSACPIALLPLRGQLLGECLPMWKILGYTQAQEGRPWLDVERLFLLIMPGGTDAHA